MPVRMGIKRTIRPKNKMPKLKINDVTVYKAIKVKDKVVPLKIHYRTVSNVNQG